MLRRIDHFHPRGCVGIQCLKLTGSIKGGQWKAARIGNRVRHEPGSACGRFAGLTSRIETFSEAGG
jgi:hypothetical protein